MVSEYLLLIKITTPQEKAQCVSWFIKTKSAIRMQRNYKTKYGKEAPACELICNWYEQFMETGMVPNKSRIGRPRTSDEDTEGKEFSCRVV